MLRQVTSDEKAELRSGLARRGTLGLPALLDDRRLEFCIPDNAFLYQAAFNKVFVWQVALGGDTYGDGPILMPDTVKSSRERSTPIGIVVSAGLQARDELESNGIALGHLVMFVHLAPWRIEVGTVGGKACHLVQLHSGDITGSIDTATMLKEREIRIRRDPDSGEHQYIDRDGKAWKPVMPAFSEDY